MLFPESCVKIDDNMKASDLSANLCGGLVRLCRARAKSRYLLQPDPGIEGSICDIHKKIN